MGSVIIPFENANFGLAWRASSSMNLRLDYAGHSSIVLKDRHVDNYHDKLRRYQDTTTLAYAMTAKRIYDARMVESTFSHAGAAQV